MKKTAWICLFLLVFTLGCLPAPISNRIETAIPAAVEPSLTPAAEVPTDIPSDGGLPPTPTVTQEQPTPSLPPPPTPTPAPTHAPLDVSYYHLRIEFSTTSDWSTLECLDADRILASRLVSTTGAVTNFSAGLSRMELNQTLRDAEQGKQVSMTVDLALDSAGVDNSLRFLLQKGAVNGSVVRFLSVSGAQTNRIYEIRHQTVVQKDPGLNPLNFQLNLSRLKEAGLLQATIQTAGIQKLVWAFYYPWYRMDDWNSSLLKDHPQTRYASDDPQVIAQHIEQAQSAGIDGFISSWWGPGDFTDQNLVRLLTLAQERNFKVTIYFETLNDTGARPENELVAWLSYAIRAYRDHPAFMKVNGKPLIVIWASGAAPLDTWQRVFSQLRAQGLDAVFLAMGYDLANLSVFDGIHEYGVFNIADLAGTTAMIGRAVRFYSLLDGSASPKIWAATVQPGYDDRLIPGREGLLQERNNGDFYRSTFEAAIASQPDWIFITTWNEWWEHTHIEPSEAFGDLYLQITRQYAELWKSQPSP